jgi:predicted GNAT family acetyltransferase
MMFKCDIGLDRPFQQLVRTDEPFTEDEQRLGENMEQSPASVEVRKDEINRLYEAVADGRVIGTLAYETTRGRVTLTHSYVDPDQRHRGVATALARYSLEDLSRGQTEIGIYCGFVADYVQDHPEFSDRADINRSALIATSATRDTNGRA